MYRRFLKRAVDVFLSLMILTIGAPVLLLIAAVVKLDSPGPAIFNQARLGMGGKVFWMHKFRTMEVDSEHTGSGVYSDRNDVRVTRIGRLLRATSLDELPQAWNVLKGDMSFIGPRPPLTYHPWPLEEYTPEQLRMFEVRPGLTGWAQVNGRRSVQWVNRIEMNVWYVDNMSFLLDAKIFFMTIGKVLTARDNENVGQTAEKQK